jgi:hypothetical protein
MPTTAGVEAIPKSTIHGQAGPGRVVPTHAVWPAAPSTIAWMPGLAMRSRWPCVGRTDHRGALVAWRGAGDVQVLARYCAARMRQDEQLLQLLFLSVYPSDQVGGVIFWSVPPDWRLEIGLAFEAALDTVEVLPSDRRNDASARAQQQRLDQAAADLAGLLSGSAPARGRPADEEGSFTIELR